MHELKEHVVNPANDRLKVVAIDGPGPGGASHVYAISGYNMPTESPEEEVTDYVRLRFQNGPINADGNGVNGLTHEVLLVIILDRLRGFQDGKFKCRENALAITHLEEAMHWLGHRTRARMAKGIEGTHTV